MGVDLMESSPAIRALFGMASEESGIDLEKLLREGGEEELKRTENAQIAVCACEIAAAEALKARGAKPSACAGHSLGEWAALYAAGVLGAREVFRLVGIRGRLMEEAIAGLPPCGMSAVLFLDPAKVEEVLRSSGLPEIFVANYNSPVQTVISGALSSLDEAEKLLQASGAKRVVRLKVAGPFHSPLMLRASERFAAELAKYDFREPAIPFFSNVTGARVVAPEEIRRLASEQIAAPVRWIEEEGAIASMGVERCVEAGPGNVLSGLWKAAIKEIPCAQAGKLAEIEALGL
jgi:[acyl-carrier-protein] S-malonyltransferase